MKQCRYNNRRGEPHIILNQGFYKNYEFIVLCLNSHPRAYICLTSNSLFYQKHYDDIDISVHGGLTFSENRLNKVLEYSEKYKTNVLSTIERDWIIGWDYTHLGDYCAYIPFSSSDKKWTTEEITEECKYAINQLIELENEEFVKLIKKEYEEWTGYEGEPYITNDNEDEEELWDFVMCNIYINGKRIEEIEKKDYDIWKEKFDKINKTEIWELVDECNHPYDPFREHCDADFYGV